MEDSDLFILLDLHLGHTNYSYPSARLLGRTVSFSMWHVRDEISKLLGIPRGQALRPAKAYVKHVIRRMNDDDGIQTK
jgi:hypothetical protein